MGNYFVANGVRRAVAAREAKLNRILAVLKESGKPDQCLLISVDQLFVPTNKAKLSTADVRYQRVLRGISTAIGRSRIPPIEIEVLGAPGQTSSVPLRDVQLV